MIVRDEAAVCDTDAYALNRAENLTEQKRLGFNIGNTIFHM